MYNNTMTAGRVLQKEISQLSELYGRVNITKRQTTQCSVVRVEREEVAPLSAVTAPRRDQSCLHLH